MESSTKCSLIKKTNQNFYHEKRTAITIIFKKTTTMMNKKEIITRLTLSETSSSKTLE